MKLIADPNNILPAITYFLMGSLAGCNFQDLQVITIPMVFSFAILLLVSWKLNILSLSEDEARSLGVNTKRLRAVAIGASALMTASAVAVAQCFFRFVKAINNASTIKTPRAADQILSFGRKETVPSELVMYWASRNT